jgi:hypothetical protein
MGLRWTHKVEFKMKSICTNQEKRVVIANWNQNGAQINTYSHDSPWLGFGSVTILLFITFYG